MPDATRTERETYTLREFCESHRISRAHFYGLQNEGLAPRTIRAGRKILISKEAARDWRREMEREANGR